MNHCRAHIRHFRCASRSFREGAQSPPALCLGKVLFVSSLASPDAGFWATLFQTRAFVRTWSNLEPHANARDSGIAFARARPDPLPVNVHGAEDRSKRQSRREV